MFALNGKALGGRIQLLDVGRCADEVILHHDQAVDGFLYAGRTQRVSGQRLG